MSTDSAILRSQNDDALDEELQKLGGRAAGAQTEADDQPDTAEPIDLPGNEITDDTLSTRVMPEKNDEFTCTRCYLVHHHSQRAPDSGGDAVCLDCAD